MMQVSIQPSAVKGIIQAPTSKSSMQRACAAALLTKGQTLIKNPGHANDDKAALGVIKDLGASIEKLQDGSLQITSNGVNPAADMVNCGESGLGIRMFAPIVSLSEKRITINGEGSLLTRPMDFFDEVLPLLNIEISSNNGKLPLLVKGPLQPKDITVDGSLSSQFLTGLLMAYAAAGADRVSITVNNLTSKPYIDLTLQVMKHFGWDVKNKSYEVFSFYKKPVQHNGFSKITYTVEGDWSGGAFLLVAGAIAGPVTVKGLSLQSTQADKAIMQALIDCGARLSVQDDQIEIGPVAALKPFHFNASDCPDLFPPLVALAAYCQGTTAIEGVGRLAHKESNRALTLQEEFGKMGVEIQLQDDLMLVNGGRGLKGAGVHSHHDHRIAMACAVAALQATGETMISDAEAVNKSYPDFYDDMRKLGAIVK